MPRFARPRSRPILPTDRRRRKTLRRRGGRDRARAAPSRVPPGWLACSGRRRDQQRQRASGPDQVERERSAGAERPHSGGERRWLGRRRAVDGNDQVGLHETEAGKRPMLIEPRHLPANKPMIPRDGRKIHGQHEGLRSGGQRLQQAGGKLDSGARWSLTRFTGCHVACRKWQRLAAPAAVHDGPIYQDCRHPAISSRIPDAAPRLPLGELEQGHSILAGDHNGREPRRRCRGACRDR